MNLYGLVGLVLLFLGEFLAILAEILYAKWKGLIPMIALITVAGIFLLLGYGVSMKHIKSMWMVYIASITAVLVLEPILIHIIVWEAPSLWAKIGFILGILGFMATFLIS